MQKKHFDLMARARGVTRCEYTCVRVRMQTHAADLQGPWPEASRLSCCRRHRRRCCNNL